MKKMSFVGLGLVALTQFGCGSPETTGQTIVRTNSPTPVATTTACASVTDLASCQAALGSRDRDGDGISDCNELFGNTITIGNQTYMAYSDPEKADTNGDGVSDKDANPAGQAYFRDPSSKREGIVTVFAKGGVDGVEASSSAAGRALNGWNTFTKFKVQAGDQIYIRNLTTTGNYWRFNGNEFNLRGEFEPNNWQSIGPISGDAATISYCMNGDSTHVANTCIAGADSAGRFGFYGTLIAKFSDADVLFANARTSGGLTPFNIGSYMNENNEWSRQTRVSENEKNRFLMLRANNKDNNLSAMAGSVQLYVSLTNTTSDYTPPTGAALQAVMNRLCSPN